MSQYECFLNFTKCFVCLKEKSPTDQTTPTASCQIPSRKEDESSLPSKGMQSNKVIILAKQTCSKLSVKFRSCI